MSEIDVLKEIPGYKAILKSVLKSQIQLLIEQLADQTGEESIILTASVNDGTLSHLGSSTGKGFLEGRDEMKSQFLGYCLKTHHKKKTTETKAPPYQRTNQRHTPYRVPQKRSPQVHPVSMQRARSEDDMSSGARLAGLDPSVQPQFDDSGNQFVKREESGNPNVQDSDGDVLTPIPTSFPSSLQLSHTQTSGDLDTSDQGHSEGQGHVGDNGSQDSDGTNDSTSATNIKIEPITENEMELEITGVEPGTTSVPADEWAQMGYGSGADGDSSLNQSADASNYRFDTKATSALEREQENFAASMSNKDHTSGTEELVSSMMKTAYASESENLGDSSFELDAFDADKKGNRTCPFCGKTWQTRAHLRRHMRSHTGERPYSCNICGQLFKQKSHMNGHRLTHFSQAEQEEGDIILKKKPY